MPEPCPRCRRLERMLLVATVYLVPSNWHEFPEQLRLLDRIKAVLPSRYRQLLNSYLGDKEHR